MGHFVKQLINWQTSKNKSIFSCNLFLDSSCKQTILKTICSNIYSFISLTYSVYNFKIYSVSLILQTLFSEFFNPIPAGGVGQFDPPCSFFYITQKVLVWGCWNFSYKPKALPLGLKPGFNTNCLNDSNKLNLCFDPLSVVRFW